MTSSSVAASIVRCRSAGPRAKGVGQRQQNAADFLELLLLERDDVVVDLDGAERLEEQARAARGGAVHDAGDARAVLGLDDEHVPAVAFGDDLLLQILWRFPCRAGTTRACRAAASAACAADRGSPSAPGSHRRRPRPTDRSCRATCAISPLNDAAPPLARSRRGNEAATRWIAARVSSTESRNVASASRRSGSSARPSTASDPRDLGQLGGGAKREDAVLRDIRNRFAGFLQQLSDLVVIGGRGEPLKTLVAHGRQRKAADGLDDAIEFEGPQGSWLHKGF